MSSTWMPGLDLEISVVEFITLRRRNHWDIAPKIILQAEWEFIGHVSFVVVCVFIHMKYLLQ